MVLECIDKTALFKLEGDAPAAEAAPAEASADHVESRARVGEEHRGSTEADEDGDENDDDGDTTSWDVEKIVRKGQSRDGTVLYRVRWLGYSASSDTWQTVEDLAGAHQAIAQYEARTRGARHKASTAGGSKALQIVPEDEYSAEVLERGPMVRVEETDLLTVGTKLWLRWDTPDYHLGTVTRVSKTPGWFDVSFEAIILEGGGRIRCFHLSRYIAEKKACWTSAGAPELLREDMVAGQTRDKTTEELLFGGGRGCGRAEVAARAGQSGGQNRKQSANAGYYDSHGRLRFWTQLPVRECSAWCGCSRNCPNRVLQKGIHTSGLTIQWCGKGKGWGITTTQPLAAGTFICEYAGQIKLNDSKSQEEEDASNRFTLGLPGGQHVVDAQSVGNIGGFMNHACEPTANCLYQAVILDGNPAQRVGIYTRCPIEANTELTVSYGSGFCRPARTAETPSRCLCSDTCTNWIATI